MKKILLGGLLGLLLLTSACVNTANIAGNWKYALVDDQNLPIPNTTQIVMLSQDDGGFTGENPYYRFVGSVYENSLDFVMVVTGETTEGFVRHVSGAVDGDKMYGVFQESHGDIGSFVAWRQP